ncbi:hypothetical protein Nmel_000645 [Mimus melanotis]
MSVNEEESYEYDWEKEKERERTFNRQSLDILEEVSHAIAFEEDKTESIGLSVELPDYVSLTILFQTSRLLHRARPQCDLTAVKQL